MVQTDCIALSIKVNKLADVRIVVMGTQSEEKDWRQHTGVAFVWPGKAAGTFCCARLGTFRRVRNIAGLLTCVSPGSRVPAEGLQVQSVLSVIPDLPCRGVNWRLLLQSFSLSVCLLSLTVSSFFQLSSEERRSARSNGYQRNWYSDLAFSDLNVGHHMFKSCFLCYGEFTLCSREFK